MVLVDRDGVVWSCGLPSQWVSVRTAGGVHHRLMTLPLHVPTHTFRCSLDCLCAFCLWWQFPVKDEVHVVL